MPQEVRHCCVAPVCCWTRGSKTWSCAALPLNECAGCKTQLWQCSVLMAGLAGPCEVWMDECQIWEPIAVLSMHSVRALDIQEALLKRAWEAQTCLVWVLRWPPRPVLIQAAWQELLHDRSLFASPRGIPWETHLPLCTRTGIPYECFRSHSHLET